MALKPWSVASTPLMSLVDGSTDLWTESAADGCGFYYNGGDISDVPISVLINDEHATEGELGSLSPGEFAFGRAEADGLAQDTVYYMPVWASLADGGTTDQWTESGSVAGEYYYTGDDLAVAPWKVEINGAEATEGTLGSLNPGEYAWGDNDSLGASTLYVKPHLDSLSDGSTDLWTVSGSGTGEYYYTGDALNVEPGLVLVNGSTASKGTLGSLAAGEYAWGDNDGLGADTLYVRPHLNSLSDGTTDLWTASGSGTGEFYYTGSVLDGEPGLVLLNGSQSSKGTLGTLAAGEYAWGDNDSLGADTLYVRLSDDADPDTKAADYVQSSYEPDNQAADYVQSSYEPDNQAADYVRSAIDPDDLGTDTIKCSQYTEVLQAGTGIECIILSILIANYGVKDAVVELVITDSSDNVKFKWWLELAATDSPWGMDSKLVIEPEGKLKINSSREDVNVYVSGDES